MPEIRVRFVLNRRRLGCAYIAGALDRMLLAPRSSDQYQIDIATEGPARGTDATLIGHGFCYRIGETALHGVWLDEVDTAGLRMSDLNRGDASTIFSSTSIHQLALDASARPANGVPSWRTVSAPVSWRSP